MHCSTKGYRRKTSNFGKAGKACCSAIAISIFLSPGSVLAQEGPQFHSSIGEQSRDGTRSGKKAERREDDILARLERRLDDQERRISELEQTVTWQSSEISSRDQQIHAANVEVQRLNLALADRDGLSQPSGARFYTAQASGGAATAQDPSVQDEPVQNTVPADSTANQTVAAAERPQSDKAVDQLLLDQGGVLLPSGKLQIEPSLDYTSISSDRVNLSGFSIFNAILIGTIRVDDINRDILTGAITARYGTGRRSQVDLRVPFVYRNDTETTGIGTGDALERRTSGHGLGDIGLTLAYQALTAKGGRPATILRVQAEFPSGKSAFEIDRVPPSEDSPELVLVEAPTGSGFYTVSPGVTFVWPIDPVVLFAGGAYNYTFGRSFDQFGYIEPGHGFEFFTGLNMSINQGVSMNFSFLDKQRFATSSNGEKIPGSGTHDARLSLGASVGLTDRMSLVLSTAAGLTDESPDFSFSVRVPYQF